MTDNKHIPQALVLLVEPDPDIAESLRYALDDEGYATAHAMSLAEALALVNRQVFHLILTDLMPPHPTSAAPADPLHGVLQLRDASDPTPIVITTAWPIPAERMAAAGFDALLPRPFAINDLLTMLESAIHQPLDPEHEREVAIIQRYCAAFDQHDLDACLAVCDENVLLLPPERTPFSEPHEIRGRAACRAYLEAELHIVSDFHFGACLYYARSHGVAMRCEESWRNDNASGGRASIAASMLFDFVGERIARIGVHANGELLTALLASSVSTAPTNGATPSG